MKPLVDGACAGNGEACNVNGTNSTNGADADGEKRGASRKSNVEAVADAGRSAQELDKKDAKKSKKCAKAKAKNTTAKSRASSMNNSMVSRPSNKKRVSAQPSMPSRPRASGCDAAAPAKRPSGLPKRQSNQNGLPSSTPKGKAKAKVVKKTVKKAPTTKKTGGLGLTDEN